MTTSAPITQLRRIAWTHTVAGEKRIGYTEELLALPDDTELYMIAEPAAEPRKVTDIKVEINLVLDRLRKLEAERDAALLRQFLQQRGVPDGAEPILEDASGTRFLIARHNGTFATGCPFKKDGTPANTPRHLFDADKLRYVGPAQP